MEKKNFFLTINGQMIAVTYEIVDVDSLRLDPDNPRIRPDAQRRFKGRVPAPKELIELVEDQPAYAGLYKSIRDNGGINDPVIVTHDGLVIEGNCRTVVHLKLKSLQGAASTWKSIQVLRLPKDIDPKLTGLLTASHHIGRKTKWSPYAQAAHIHYLVNTANISLEVIASETRMNDKQVRDYLATYKFLTEEVAKAKGKGDGEGLDRKWSHAYEFIKNPKLKVHRDNAEDRKAVIKLIVDDEISGAQVRKLPDILGNKKSNAALKKDGFKPAVAALRKADPVAGSELLQKIEKLTQLLKDAPIEEASVFGEKKAHDVLRALHTQIVDLAKLKKVELGDGHG